MAGVIITGGLGVLGQAVAQAFKAAGFKIALIDHAAVAEPTPDFTVSGVDLADADQAVEAFEQAWTALGDVRALINVAGAFAFEMIDGGDPVLWDRLFNANLKTCANMCRAAAPAKRWRNRQHRRVGRRTRRRGLGGLCRLESGRGATDRELSGRIGGARPRERRPAVDPRYAAKPQGHARYRSRVLDEAGRCGRRHRVPGHRGQPSDQWGAHSSLRADEAIGAEPDCKRPRSA